MERIEGIGSSASPFILEGNNSTLEINIFSTENCIGKYSSLLE